MPQTDAAKSTSASRFLQTFALSGRSRLEHGQNARMLEVAGCDPFEVRTNTAQFGRHKAVHKMQAPIQPGKQLVLNPRNEPPRVTSVQFGLNLGEINNAH